MLASEAPTAATSSARGNFLADFAGGRSAVVAAVVLAMLVLTATLAPWIVPQDPYDLAKLDILDAQLPPGSIAGDGSMRYLLGADGQGRDMLSAIVYGLRISVFVGVASTLVAAAIGVSLGLMAGYAGGRVDGLIMRIADMQLYPAYDAGMPRFVTMRNEGVAKMLDAFEVG